VRVNREHTVTNVRQSLSERKSDKQKYEERRQKLARAWSVTLKKLRKKYHIKHDRGMRVESQQLHEINYPAGFLDELDDADKERLEELSEILDMTMSYPYSFSITTATPPKLWKGRALIKYRYRNVPFLSAVLSFHPEKFSFSTYASGRDKEDRLEDAAHYKTLLKGFLEDQGWVEARLY
jgi:hypothetical protein